MRGAVERHPVLACAAALLLTGIGMVLAVSAVTLAVVFPIYLVFRL